MRINNNIAALAAYNVTSMTQSELAGALRKLSTGLRINSAADDAAGLAISEKMRGQVNGLDRASSNAQDGISMIQTAEGALQEVHSSLQRMRELSVQAANDTMTQQDRSYIQLEIDKIKEEIGRISQTTQFNKKKLLDGSSDVLWSADKLGVWLNVKGPLTSKDQFGQSSETDGNYMISVAAVKAGRNQVLKSNIMTLMEDSSAVAGKNSRLGDIANFTDANGISILESPQTLTVSFEGGQSASIAVYKDDTVGAFGEKLAAAVQQASGLQTAEGSPVQFVGEQIVSPGDGDLIAKWLGASGAKINEFFGLTGSGKTLVIKFAEPMGDSPGMYVQSSSNSNEIYLFMNPDICKPGVNLSSTVAHEMVHASVAANLNVALAQEENNGSGAWFAEGLAEYISVGNERTVQTAQREAGNYETYIKERITDLFGLNDAGKDALSEEILHGNPTDETFDTLYTAGYLAVRYFDEMSKANGGTGVEGLMTELRTTGGTAAAMDEAIKNASNGFFTELRGNGAKSLETLLTDDASFLARVAAEDPYVDAGAVGGYYVNGKTGPMAPAGEVIGASPVQANPLAAYGWERVKWTGADSGSSDLLAFSAAKANTLQSVEGTLLIHSVIAGSAGRMTISGDEQLLNALGFAEVQSAADTTYSAMITDAHNGATLASGIKFSGGAIIEGLRNIDINLSANFALDTDGKNTSFDGYGTYKFNAGNDNFIVHIASNATILQIGANEKEDLNISFGDVGIRALGIHKVSLMSRESAARSITIIDNAIDNISSKRASLGAYQNRLEHTIINLTAAAENLTSAESRIRDADMAKEMMNFTKLNILLQSGSAMMSQANQLPQAALSLLR